MTTDWWPSYGGLIDPARARKPPLEKVQAIAGATRRLPSTLVGLGGSSVLARLCGSPGTTTGVVLRPTEGIRLVEPVNEMHSDKRKASS